MRNYVFDFEQIYLRNAFFSDPEAFFEDANPNAKWSFYKKFKQFSKDNEITSDLRLENIEAERLIYDDRIGLITLQGFAFGMPNCCNHLYFLYDFLDKRASFCFSANGMQLRENEQMSPALFVADSPRKVQYFEMLFSKDLVMQFNFECRYFLAKFMGLENVFLPPLIEEDRGYAKTGALKEFECDKYCKRKFFYDLSRVPKGGDYLTLCPKCLSIKMHTK